MKTDKFRLKAPDNWINDPNGFIYYKGYYHLFYQYFPYGPRWGTMHWGHGVSKDLVHWEHRGIALYPSVRGDQNGCFSGSAVEKDGKLCLVYTGVRYEKVNPEDPHTCLDDQFESVQLMIQSEDGFEFDNQGGKKVIIPPMEDPEIADRTHTRDPKVWRGKDGWYLILGSTVKGDYGEVLFYRSQDMENWTYVNQAAKGPGYGWMWECPDLFETEGGSVLFISAMKIADEKEMHSNHAICFPVRFQEEGCILEIPDDYQYLDYGLDLYAPQTALDQEGRRTMVAWVRMPEPKKEGWIGMMCCPRVVEAHEGHIYFRIHPNIRAAFSKKISFADQGLPEGYMASFDLEEGEEVNLGGFIISRKNHRIVTDRTQVFPQVPNAHLISQTPEIKEGSKIEVLASPDLIEVFVNDGEYVISNAVYGLGNSIGSSTEKQIELYTLA